MSNRAAGRSRLSWLREGLLTIGAVAGLLCILLAIASVAFDTRPLVFRSGSMSPTIRTGALAIAHEVSAEDLYKGDIVSVFTPDGARVTHRIVDITQRPGRATLVLQGDANDSPDAIPYDVDSADRVMFSIPKAGYVVAWLTGPSGIILLGLYAGFLAVVLFSRDKPERKRGGARRAGQAVIAVALLGGGIGAGALTLDRSAMTLASWTNGVTATGSTFTADHLRPVAITCSGAGLLLRPKISWSAPTSGPAPTGGYIVTYTGSGVGGSSGTATIAVGTTEWQFPSGLVSIGASYRITVQTALGNWRSVPSNAVVVTVTSLIVSAVTTCNNNPA